LLFHGHAPGIVSTVEHVQGICDACYMPRYVVQMTVPDPDQNRIRSVLVFRLHACSTKSCDMSEKVGLRWVPGVEGAYCAPCPMRVQCLQGRHYGQHTMDYGQHTMDKTKAIMVGSLQTGIQ